MRGDAPVTAPVVRAPAAQPAAALVDRIRAGIIGEGEVLDGPYGPRRITYADYTASDRPLDFIEDITREQMLPRYANTRTDSSMCVPSWLPFLQRPGAAGTSRSRPGTSRHPAVELPGTRSRCGHCLSLFLRAPPTAQRHRSTGTRKHHTDRTRPARQGNVQAAAGARGRHTGSYVPAPRCRTTVLAGCGHARVQGPSHMIRS